MFALTAAHVSHETVQNRLARHFDLLQRANPSMRLSVHRYGLTLLVFDAGSPFGQFEESDGGFDLTGGFEAAGGIGEFARISLNVDALGSKLSGETDRCASWPLYCSETAEGAAVSNDPHALALALQLTDLNESSVFQMVTLQFVLNRCTTIDGVLRLWQGERVTFDSRLRSCSFERIYDAHRFARQVDASGENLEEYIAATYASLVASIPAYRLDENDVVCTLSGGLDSRLVVGALRDAGIEAAETLTFNLSATDEGDVGRQIAERLGYQHESADLPASGKQVLHEAWLLTGGQKTVHAASDNLCIMREALSTREHVRVVTATVGDPLDGSLVPGFSDFTDSSRVSVCAEYWMRALSSNAAAEQGFGRSAVARRHLKELRRSLRGSFDQASGVTAAEKMTYFDYTRRGPVFSHVTTSKLSTNVLELQPGLAPEYVERFYGIRPVDLAQRNFYRRLIWRMLPSLRDVIYHNTGHEISPEYSAPGPMSWKLRALLALPIGVQQWIERAIAGQSKAPAAQVPTETLHYQSLIEPELGSRVELTDNLVFTLGNVRADAFQRVNTAAAVAACLWTKQHIQGRRVSDEALQVVAA